MTELSEEDKKNWKWLKCDKCGVQHPDETVFHIDAQGLYCSQCNPDLGDSK